MTNKEVARTLVEIATLLELKGESPFKSRAYENVARQIEQLDADITELAGQERLREIKGVGEALEQKIEELVTTGKLGYLESLRAQFPETLFQLFAIPGLGAKRIKQLYDEKQITSLNRLEQACTNGELDGMKGFGPKMCEKIREGIAFARKHHGLFNYDVAWAHARHLLEWMRKFKAVTRAEIAGSLRRHREVVKDIDIIVSSAHPVEVMKHFVKYDAVQQITGQGETKSSVILIGGIGADLRVVSDEQFPYALAHFTGSKEHNVVMRQRAKDLGLKLNEYGLFKDGELAPCKDEADIYKRLGLPYIPPELREDRGEFALKATPRLVTPKDLRGVFHCHTTYSDGQNSLQEMKEAAKEMGFTYMTITDHSRSAAYAGGLQFEDVLDQHREIDLLNAMDGQFRLLKGIESDILADGNLDYEDDVLRRFELIIISVHSGLNMTEKDATRRVIKAIEHPYSTILGHPSGRLLLARQGYMLDYEKVFDACIANRVAVEINGNAKRLDLDWRYVHRAKEKGVKFTIGPDAHNVLGIQNIEFGVGIARKGWLEPHDVLNCMTADQFLAWRAGRA